MENNRDLENLLKSFESIKEVIEEPVRERVTVSAAEKLPETDEERTLYRYMMSIRARKLTNAVDKDGKNPEGYYYNPEKKEFDPEYSPFEDSRFRSTKAAEDTVERISRVEDIDLLQTNIDSMHEQIDKNPALANNESMKNALEAEEAKRNAHIEKISQIIAKQDQLVSRCEHLQNYLEKQIALFSKEFTEFQTRFLNSSREEKLRIKKSGEGHDIVQNYASIRELDRQLAMIRTATDSAKRIADAWDPNNLSCLEDVLDETYRSIRIIGDFQTKREADIVVRFNELTNSYDVYLRQYDSVSDEDIEKGVIPELHSDKVSISADEFSAETLNKQISILRNKQKVNELQDKITIITFPDGTVVPTIGSNIEIVIDEKIKNEHTKARKNRKETRKNAASEEPKKEEPKKEAPKEEPKEPSILEGLKGGEIFRDAHNEYEFNADATIEKYLKEGGEMDAAGLYKNPETGEFDPKYNPLDDPKYQIFDVYESTEKINATATMDKYRAAGYSKNELGVYFNPKTDEYDPSYNPLNDPMFQVKETVRRRIGTMAGYELAKNPDLTLAPEKTVVRETTPVIPEPTKMESTPVIPEPTKVEPTPVDDTVTPVAPVAGVVETPVAAETAPEVETPTRVAGTPTPEPTRRTVLDRNRGDRLRIPYILNKLTDGVVAKSMGTKAARRLSAKNISLSPKGLFNFREHDYALQKLPKTIVGLITYIPVTIVKGIYKAVQAVKTTMDDEYSWELFRQHFKDLSEEEKGILFNGLQTSEVKRVGITDTEAVLLEDLVCQWGYEKAQELQRQQISIAAKVVDDARKYVAIKSSLDSKTLNPTERMNLEAQLENLSRGKADLLLQREEMLDQINKFTNGGTQGFRQTMKDIRSHQSFRGQHFAKGLTYDEEVNKAQSDAQLRLLNAIRSDSPTKDSDAMLAFIETEKIISDATELDGKKQVGSREYEIEVNEMNHNQDTFYRDWIAAFALAGQAFAVGRQVIDNINAGRIINESEAVQSYQDQIQQYGRELQGDAQQMYLGNQATNVELAGANHTYGEVGALASGDFNFNSTVYRGLDDQLHTVIEPEQINALTTMQNITTKVANGNISLQEGLLQQAQVCQQQCTTLQATCQAMQEPLRLYVEAHPEFEYGALMESTNQLVSNAQLIANGQFAAADVARIASSLQSFEFNLSAIPGLGSAVADYVPAIVSTASMLTLVGSIQGKINEKYMNGELSEEFCEALDSIDAAQLAQAQGRTR